jgi:hypothetical protein
MEHIALACDVAAPKTKTRAWREANKYRWRLFERH